MPLHVLRRAWSAFTLTDRLFRFAEAYGDSKAVKPMRLDCLKLEDRIVPAKPLPTPVIHLGAGPGFAPVVRAINAETGVTVFEKTVYEATFTGGVRIATADFTGDGYPDLAVAPGVGGGPRVRILDGKTGLTIPGPLGDFYAFEPSFHGGVSIAAADVSGDSVPDLIAAAGEGGGPRVRVFSGKDGTVLSDFFAYAPEFRGGAQVAAADFTGDGHADIAVGAGPGGGPHVRVFDAMTMAPLAGPLGGFFAFDPSERGGAQVGTDYLAGDVTGDGVPDLVVGGGAGKAPKVRVFSGKDGSLAGEFLAYGDEMTDGVQVATAYVDDDKDADIVTAPLPGSADPRVRVFSGTTGQLVGGPAGDFTLDGPFAGGVHLSAGNDPPATVDIVKSEDGVEGAAPASVRVERTGPTDNPLTVYLTVATAADGPATANVDYDPAFSVTIPAGDEAAQAFYPVLPHPGAAAYKKNLVAKIRYGLDYLIGSSSVDGVTLAVSGGSGTTSPPPPTPELPTPSFPDWMPSADPFRGGVRPSLQDTDPGFTKPYRSLPGDRNVDKGFMVPAPPGPSIDPGFSLANSVIGNQGAAVGTPQVGAKETSLERSQSGVDWTGVLSLISNDVGTCDCKTIDGVIRTTSSAPSLYSGDGPVGVGGGLNSIAQVKMFPNDVVGIVSGNGTVLYFDRDATVTTPTYRSRRGESGMRTLEFRIGEDGGTADILLYRIDKNEVFDFYDTDLSTPEGLRGRLKSITNDGCVKAYHYTTDNVLADITTEYADGREERYSFEWGTEADIGLMRRITLEERQSKQSVWVKYGSAFYTYYGPQDANGLPRDLKTVEMDDASGTSYGTKYYRYYTRGGPGFAHGLKFAVGADSMLRIRAAGLSPFTATDAQLARYADNYVEYDSQHRVTKHVVQGDGCSICGAGLGTYLYSYLDSSNAPGPNSWKRRTTEVRPDGSIANVYTNAFGQVMLYVQSESSSVDGQKIYFKYDGFGRLILEARPSAVRYYNEALPDLVGFNAGGNEGWLRDHDGVLMKYTYGTSTSISESGSGSVEGFGSSISLMNGTLGTPVPQLAVDYQAHVVGDNTVYFPSTITDYTNDNGTGAAVTSLVYADWYPDTAQAKSVKLVMPYTPGQNAGAATTLEMRYDKQGRPLATKGGDDSITLLKYNKLSGGVSEIDEDAAYTNDLPITWQTTGGTQTPRTTTFERDVKDRVLETVEPGGRKTFERYDDVNGAVRLYQWDADADKQTGPTLLKRLDPSGTYFETLTMTATPALSDGKPSGLEPVDGVTSIVRQHIDDAGQVVDEDDYTTLEGDYTTGVLPGGRFLHTRMDYTFGGMPNRTVEPSGTITRTVYDYLQRVSSVWIGTNDTPASDSWSPNNPAGMVKLKSYAYDEDGNVNSVTEYPGGTAASRVTTFGYDWRDRLVAVKTGAQASEIAIQTLQAANVNRALTRLEYDNLGHVINSRVYDGDGVPVDGAPAATLLRAWTHTSYDALGRIYQTDDYGVDTSGHVATTTPSTTKIWYDDRGFAAKTLTPSGLAVKTKYDGQGRLVAEWLTDAGGDSTDADARTIAGDVVWSQTNYGYSADEKTLTITSRQRAAEATATGDLASAPNRTTTARLVYDAADRLVESIDYGTNATAATTARTTQYEYDDAGRLRDETDPLGHITRTLYDMLGRPTSTTMAADSLALTTTAEYDAGGRLYQITAPGGRVTRYSYDLQDRVTTLEERVQDSTLTRTSTFAYLQTGDLKSESQASANGLATSFTYDVLGRPRTTTSNGFGISNYVTSASYDVLGRVTKSTDARGNATTTAYDDAARTITVTDPENRTSQSKYDLAGRTVSVFDGYGKETTLAYDLLDRVTSVSDPLHHTTGYTYLTAGTTDVTTDALTHTSKLVYDRFGQVGSVVDGLNRATSMLYDAAGRLTDITDPRLVTTHAEYDDLNRVTGVTEDAGGTLERTTGYEYDPDTGDLATVTDPLGRQTQYRYDAAGRVETVTLASSSTTTVPFTITAGYDKMDRVTSVVRPGGRESDYAYDGAGELLTATDGVGTPLVRASHYTYDPNGNRLTVTDPLGHISSTSYDKTNRPLSMADALTHATTLTYDANGQVKTLTDPNANVTTWNYDDAGRKTAETDPNNKSTTYNYDDANRLTKVTDRIGRAREYHYDAADQMDGEKWYLAASPSSIVKSISYGHDANGNLTSATDALSGGGNPNFDVTIAYDALNRPSHTTQPFGVTLDFAYDKADNRTQVIDNKGGQSDYVYDDLNRLKTLTLSGSGVTGTSTAWAYDKTTADLTSVTKAVNGTASGKTTFGYDALGRNDSVTQSNGSGVTVGSYTYTRDLADRLTGSTFVTGGVTSSHSFSYYDDNQLKVADGVLSKYDDGGNLTGTFNATSGAQLTSSTYGAANRLQNDGVYTYTYDDAGQMTGKSKAGESWTYGYDSNGQMVSASNNTDAVNYTFDAFGNRLSRVQSGGTSKTERFAYDGADAFLDLDGSNAVTVHRQYGPGVDNLLSRQSGGSVEWYGTDMQGSVRQVFDNAGKQTSWADYEAHGALVGGSLTDRYGFTGREEDDLTGQRYHRARVVDGQSWTSEDPMGFAAGDSNLRRYAGNGPTNGTDPSGMWTRDGIVAELIKKGRPDLARWLGTVLLGEDTYFYNSYTSQFENGKLTFQISSRKSNSEAADAIISHVTHDDDSFFHFKHWLEDQIIFKITMTQTESFTDALKAYQEHLIRGSAAAGASGAAFIRSVYTASTGVGLADTFIELLDKDISELSISELATLAVIGGKAAGRTIVMGKNGITRQLSKGGNTVADLMRFAGKSSTKITKEEIKHLNKMMLHETNGKVKVKHFSEATAELRKKMGDTPGAFVTVKNGDTATIFINDNADVGAFFHEYFHAMHWYSNKSVYDGLGKLTKETHVMRSFLDDWHTFSKEQRQHQINSLERYIATRNTFGHTAEELAAAQLALGEAQRRLGEKTCEAVVRLP